MVKLLSKSSNCRKAILLAIVVFVLDGGSASASSSEVYAIRDFRTGVEARDENLSLRNDGSVALSPGMPNDTFDGKVLSTRKWEVYAWNQPGALEQNGKLVMSTRGDVEHSAVEVRTHYVLIGDFDIQVDFEGGQGWASPPSDHIDASVGLVLGGSRHSGLGPEYSSRYSFSRTRFADGNDVVMLYSPEKGSLASVPTGARRGRFGITRQGSTCRFWYDIGKGWELLYESDISASDAVVCLGVSNTLSRHAFAAAFDNFRVNSGTTTYQREGGIRTAAQDFTKGVILDSLQVDADIPKDSYISVKVYGREQSDPKWRFLGEYHFTAEAKEVKISPPAYVDSVKFGGAGPDGVRLASMNGNSLPVLRGIALKARSPEEPPEVNVIQPRPNSAGKWGIYELTVKHSKTYSNPFWDVLVTGRFTGPDRQATVAEGFYYDLGTWKIRFAPTQEGTWTYSVRATTPEGSTTSGGSFACTSAAPGNHGFITVGKTNRHVFEHTDGTAFIPVGIYQGPPADTGSRLGFPLGPSQETDLWKYLTEHRVNFYRLQMYWLDTYPPLDDGDILQRSGGLDRYDLKSAKAIDRWLAETQQSGINWLMCLMSFYDVAQAPFAKCYWSATRGGPYERWVEVYSTANRDGLELQQKYFRYVINRWAACQNVFMWEYNNESAHVTDIEWAQAMDEIIDQADPHGRPHSVSFLNYDWAKISPVNSWSTVDVTDDHWYPRNGFTKFNVDHLVHQAVLERNRRFDKPAFIGELGVEGWERDTVKGWIDYLRLAHWAAFMGGGSSNFWLSCVTGIPSQMQSRSREMIDILPAFSKITSNIKNYAKMKPDDGAVSVADTRSLRAYCLSGENERLVYIHHHSDHETIVTGKKLFITLPGSQHYSATWFDPSTGASVSTDSGTTGEGRVALAIPDFAIDIALYVSTSEPADKKGS